MSAGASSRSSSWPWMTEDIEGTENPLMPTLTTTKSARWAGITLLVALGQLGLHLPHYLAETTSPAGYAAYPGLILVLMMVVVVVAAVAIVRNRPVGWRLGTGVPSSRCCSMSSR